MIHVLQALTQRSTVVFHGVQYISLADCIPIYGIRSVAVFIHSSKFWRLRMAHQGGGTGLDDRVNVFCELEMTFVKTNSVLACAISNNAALLQINSHLSQCQVRLYV
jgi:hypothetical protein